MFLSVIIPTRNRAEYLEGTLDSITLQSYPQALFEVIVVDNGSTDKTKAVCDAYLMQLLNLRYYYDDTPGLHVGRHLGMRQARSDILVYADDDIEAFPTWLEAIAESFQDPEVVLVGGKSLPKFESEPPAWIRKMWEKDNNANRILEYLSILDFGNEIKEINPYFAFGCNFSVRKSIVLEAGGFHPDAMPQYMIKYRGDGESHISKYILEMGYKTMYDPRACIYHRVSSNRMTDDYFRQRAYKQGISDSYAFVRLNFDKYPLFRMQISYFIKITSRLLKMGMKMIGKRERRFYLSYVSGYKYHMHKVFHDKDLFKWVIKSSYL